MRKKQEIRRLLKKGLSFALALSMVFSAAPVFNFTTKTANAFTKNTKGSIELGEVTVVDRTNLTFKFENPTVTLNGDEGSKGLTIISLLVDSGYFSLGKAALETGNSIKYQGIITKDNGSSSYVADSDFTVDKKYTSITITGDEISEEDVCEFLKNITFTQADKDTSQTISAAVSDIDTEDKGVMVNPDGQLHFYEFVPYDTSDNNPETGNTWQNAYALAKQRSFHGLKGYLATITSEEEQQFIVHSLGTIEGWIGATRAVYNQNLIEYLTSDKYTGNAEIPADISNFSRPEADADTFNLPKNIADVPVAGGHRSPSYYFNNIADSSLGLKTWYWVNGPEAGQPFYYGHNGNYTRGHIECDGYWGIEDVYPDSTANNNSGKTNKEAVDEILANDKTKDYNKYFTPTKEDKYTATGKTFYQLNFGDSNVTYSRWNDREPNDSYDREMFVTYAFKGIADGRWNDWSNRTTRQYGDSSTSDGASGYYVEYSYYNGGLSDAEDAEDLAPVTKDIKIINVFDPSLNIKITNNATGNVEDISPDYNPDDGRSEDDPYVVNITTKDDTDAVTIDAVPSLDVEGDTVEIQRLDNGSYVPVDPEDYDAVPINPGDNIFLITYTDPDGEKTDYYVNIKREDETSIPVVSIDPTDPDNPNAPDPVISDNNASISTPNEPAEYADEYVERKIITVDHDTTSLNLGADITINGESISRFSNDPTVTTIVLDGPATFRADTDSYIVDGLVSSPMDSVVEIQVTADGETYHYIYTIIRERGQFTVTATNPKPVTNDNTYGVDGPTESTNERLSDKSVVQYYYDIYTSSDIYTVDLTPNIPVSTSIETVYEYVNVNSQKKGEMERTVDLSRESLPSGIVNVEVPEDENYYNQIIYTVLETDTNITSVYNYRVHHYPDDMTDVNHIAENPDDPDTSFPPTVTAEDPVEDEAQDATSHCTTVKVTVLVPYEEENVKITPELVNTAATILKDDVTSTLPDGASLENNLEEHDGYVTVTGLSVDEDSVVSIPVLSYDKTEKTTYEYTIKRAPKSPVNDESMDIDAYNGDKNVPEEEKYDGIEKEKTPDATTNTIYFDVEVDNEVTDIDVDLLYDEDFYSPDLTKMTTNGSADVSFEGTVVSAKNLVAEETEIITVPVNSLAGGDDITYVVRITRKPVQSSIADADTKAENPDSDEEDDKPYVETGDKTPAEDDDKTEGVSNNVIPVTIIVPNSETKVDIYPELVDKVAVIDTENVTVDLADGVIIKNNLKKHEGYVSLENLSTTEDSVVQITITSSDNTVENTYIYTVKRMPETNLDDFNIDSENGDDTVADKEEGIEETKSTDPDTNTVYYDITVDNPITDVLVSLEYDKDLYVPDFENMTTDGDATVKVNDDGTISAVDLVAGETETITVPVKSKAGNETINYVVRIKRMEAEETATPVVTDTPADTDEPAATVEPTDTASDTTDAPSDTTVAPSSSPANSTTTPANTTTTPAQTKTPVTTLSPSISPKTSSTPRPTTGVVGHVSTPSTVATPTPTDDGTVPTFTMDGKTITLNGDQVNLSDYITNIAGADEVFYHCCAHSIVAIDKNGVVRAMRKGKSYVHVIIKKDGKYYDYTIRIVATRATDTKYYGTLVNVDGLSYEVMDDGTARLSSLNYSYSASNVVNVADTITYAGQNLPVTGIAPYAFIRNKKVTQINIGKNVKDIGNTSFAGMVKLKKFTVSAENPYIKTFKKGNYAHMLLTKDGTTLLAMAGARGTVKIPGSVTRINEYACAVNRMSRLIIGKKVRTIDPCAFAHDHKLVRVEFKGNVPNMSFNCILDKMNYKKGKVFVPKRYYAKYKKAFKSAVGRKQFISLKFLKKK
ncbi:MAG: leucine-rich repeat protein [Lachnospiraceae bacterium]|nr:leucine-rich repeat protein [Lachnospiraceae bacterium]